MELSTNRIKMPMFQVGILCILVTICTYTIFRAETFIRTTDVFVNKTVSTMDQLEQSMTRVEQSLSEVQAANEKAAAAAITEREKPKAKTTRHSRTEAAAPKTSTTTIAAPTSRPASGFFSRIGDKMASIFDGGKAPHIAPPPTGTTNQ